MEGIVKSTATAILTLDMSGNWGCGVYTSTGEWFMLQWPISWKGVHITVKELLPLVLGVALWGKRWFGDSVVCRCDNAAVVAILQPGWCKDDLAMHLLRCLFFWLATYQVKIVGKHIPGTQNGPAAGQVATNLSSRLDISELHNLVVKYIFYKGAYVAESTHRSYSSAQRCYLNFCRRAGFQALPTTETGLCFSGKKEGQLKHICLQFVSCILQKGNPIHLYLV